MMNNFVFFGFCALLLAIGYIILDLFGVFKKQQFIKKLCVGFPLGMGVFILQMFFYSALNIPWSIVALFVPLGMIIVIYGYSKKQQFFLEKKILKFGQKENLFFLAIILLFIYSLLQSQIRPLLAWDGIANWFMMGKGFFLNARISPAFYQYLHIDNPPGVSLIIAGYYILIGNVNDQSALLLFGVIYGALLLSFYIFLKEYTSKFHASIFTFLFASTPSLIRQAGRFDAGYVDIVLALFFFLSGILLREGVQHKDKKLLIVGMYLASIATVIKNEGLPFFIIYILLLYFFCFKNHLQLAYKHFLPPIFIFLTWQIYKLTQNTFNTYYLHSSIVLLRIPIIVLEGVKEFCNIARWNFLWIAFFASLSIRWRVILKDPLVQLILLQLLAYYVIYVFTPLDYVDHMHASFDRLILQISPLAMFVVAEVSYIVISKFYINYVEKNKIPRSKNTRSTR